MRIYSARRRLTADQVRHARRVYDTAKPLRDEIRELRARVRQLEHQLLKVPTISDVARQLNMSDTSLLRVVQRRTYKEMQ